MPESCSSWSLVRQRGPRSSACGPTTEIRPRRLRGWCEIVVVSWSGSWTLRQPRSRGDLQPRSNLVGHRIGGESKLLSEHLLGRACAVVVDADAQPIVAHDTLPRWGASGLDRDLPHTLGEDLLAIHGVLLLERLQAQGAHDAHFLTLPLQSGSGNGGEMKLAARGQDDGIRATAGRFLHDVNAPKGVTRIEPRVALDVRELLSRERESRRAILSPKRHGPGDRTLEGVRGPGDVEIRYEAQGPELLDRLMRGPVFAKKNGVVRVDPNALLLHQRAEAHARTHVIAEDEERRAEGNDAAAERHAVADGAHAVLADAVVKVPSLELSGANAAGVFHQRLGRPRQVGRASDERRNELGDDLLDSTGVVARRIILVWGRFDQLLEQAARHGLLLERIELRRDVRMGFAPDLVASFPCVVLFCEVAGALFEQPVHLVGHVEEAAWIPAHGLLRGGDFVFSKRLAVRLLRVVLGRRAIADMRSRADKARLRMARLMGDRSVDRGANLHGVVSVVEKLREPSVRLEAFAGVLGVRESRVPFDRDVVVVVDENQVVELQVPRHARRFVADALHQIAVAGEAEDA